MRKVSFLQRVVLAAVLVTLAAPAFAQSKAKSCQLLSERLVSQQRLLELREQELDDAKTEAARKRITRQIETNRRYIVEIQARMRVEECPS